MRKHSRITTKELISKTVVPGESGAAEEEHGFKSAVEEATKAFALALAESTMHYTVMGTAGASKALAHFHEHATQLEKAIVQATR